MPSELTWLGHNAWSIVVGGRQVLLDPFLDESPVAAVRSDGVKADFILVSHGHFDHVGDAEKIGAGPEPRSSPPSKSASGSARRGSKSRMR